MKRTALSEEPGAAFGPLTPFALRAAQPQREGRWPGYVLRPTLAGHPRARRAALNAVQARNEPGHREWGLRPYPNHLPRHRMVSLHVARHHSCSRAVVVPPGAGPIRGAGVARPAGVDAADLVELGGAPRAWAGERGTATALGRGRWRWACADRRAFAGSPGPPALARNLACAKRRAAAKAPSVPLASAGSFHASR